MNELETTRMERRDGSYWIQARQWLPQPVEELWPFFADARNLERITPDFLRFQVVTPEPIEMKVGALIDYRLKVHGVPISWRTRITEWEPPFRFKDFQLSGPYALWDHEHTFEPMSGGTLCTDRVEYRLPLGPLGRVAHSLFVSRDVRNIFAHRRQTLAALFAANEPAAS